MTQFFACYQFDTKMPNINHFESCAEMVTAVERLVIGLFERECAPCVFGAKEKPWSQNSIGNRYNWIEIAKMVIDCFKSKCILTVRHRRKYQVISLFFSCGCIEYKRKLNWISTLLFNSFPLRIDSIAIDKLFPMFSSLRERCNIWNSSSLKLMGHREYYVKCGSMSFSTKTQRWEWFIAIIETREEKNRSIKWKQQQRVKIQ